MIKEKLIKILSEILKTKKIDFKKKVKLQSLKNWDSLAQINFMMALEENFEIRFSIEEISKLKYLDDFEKMIKKKINTKQN
tara:strand:- start:843 stop:1085 length:243 start_codon:yes stop_codon:yes gene_type:complete